MTNESMKTASESSIHQTPEAKQAALNDIGIKWSKFSKHDLSALKSNDDLEIDAWGAFHQE